MPSTSHWCPLMSAAPRGRGGMGPEGDPNGGEGDCRRGGPRKELFGGGSKSGGSWWLDGFNGRWGRDARFPAEIRTQELKSFRLIRRKSFKFDSLHSLFPPFSLLFWFLFLQVPSTGTYAPFCTDIHFVYRYTYIGVAGPPKK